MFFGMSMPMIIHGSRRVKQDMVAAFKEHYRTFASSEFTRDQNIKAIFAFPDTGDPLLYYHMFWSRDAAIMAKYASAQDLESTYASTAEAPDTLEVYGGWTAATVEASEVNPCVRYNFHTPMAGFIKTGGDGEQGPPLIGFFRRSVKPERIDALASSFQKVCDMWHERPGILCATVSRDATEPDVVHDLRIFANPAAYAAHVDKSDTALTSAMEEWFENYDTSVPFRGEMYAADTRDESMRTNSLKTSGPTMRAAFAQFHYGETAGMLGPMPDMTKNDPREP